MNKGYPPEIAEILVNSCATTGCHNTVSKNAAGGLDLSSWDALFEGGFGGAAVVPYRSDQSYLTFFLNSDSSQGDCHYPYYAVQRKSLIQ